MKNLFCLIFAMTVLSAGAQTGYKMINGKVYSTFDTGPWTVFNDHLRVIGIAQDGFICETYTTRNRQTGTEVSGSANRRFTPITTAMIVPGEKLILKNYYGQYNVGIGTDINPIIKGIRTGQTEISLSDGIWKTGHSSSGYHVTVFVYDLGLDYTPPARALTATEQAAMIKKKSDQEGKTVRWLMSEATNGSPSAQCSLGVRYMKGQGVPKNEVTGRYWLVQAGANGSSEATGELAALDTVQTNSVETATNSVQ